MRLASQHPEFPGRGDGETDRIPIGSVGHSLTDNKFQQQLHRGHCMRRPSPALPLARGQLTIHSQVSSARQATAPTPRFNGIGKVPICIWRQLLASINRVIRSTPRLGRTIGSNATSIATAEPHTATKSAGSAGRALADCPQAVLIGNVTGQYTQTLPNRRRHLHRQRCSLLLCPAYAADFDAAVEPARLPEVMRPPSGLGSQRELLLRLLCGLWL